ncbi:hypothetical protein [Aneurinibacillus tyrosinisolvens]|uniref:hypothetical protein n=1 Tax=Aneurinibacillus tyrosinisolvens TaxID=1443435 RepID=UPI00063EECDC|nr:hypothetical protein [Aneurinibacillus tyrosinisolvens]
MNEELISAIKKELQGIKSEIQQVAEGQERIRLKIEQLSNEHADHFDRINAKLNKTKEKIQL